MNILAVIPARGGSKGIPRKNIRLMAGKPLISYAITNAINSIYNLTVVVTTDDEEIKSISKNYGAEIIERPDVLATDIVTLDPVIYQAVNEMERIKGLRYDVVITMQPTSPLLKLKTLDSAIKFFLENSVDTIISGVNNPHLAWTKQGDKCVPLYKERLNRQYLPKHLSETGAFVISKREFVAEGNRFGPNVSIFEVPHEESVDIDTPQDWWIVEKELAKKNILIRIDGYAEIGMGHVYRGLLLAENLIDHQIKFVISRKSDLGISKIKSSFFPYEVIEKNEDILSLIDKYNCDIVVNDILNTDEDYIVKLKKTGVRVVNFEDLGQGANYADAVINDLYEHQREGKNYYWGSDYYLIRDEFLLAEPKEFQDNVSEILVLFGGTDPDNLTKKLVNITSRIPEELNIHTTIILGMGYKQVEELKEIVNRLNSNIDIVQDVKLMTEYMSKADIAISSQGRTMLELASMAVPTILLAQNERETDHEFGYFKNGFINLGLGNEIKEDTIYQTIMWLIKSPQIRYEIKKQMLSKDLKNGMRRVKKIILDED